jgi:hypothetical protein
LPRQERADVAGEACHRSRQRDFHRLDDVNLQHLHHFQLEAADAILRSKHWHRLNGCYGSILLKYSVNAVDPIFFASLVRFLR